MSDPRPRGGDPEEPESPKGISLTMMYAIFAFALLAAIGLALLIVLPFYHHR